MRRAASKDVPKPLDARWADVLLVLPSIAQDAPVTDIASSLAFFTGPGCDYGRAAATEFGKDYLGKFEKQQRQKKAKNRTAALGRPVSAAREDHRPSPDTAARKPEKEASATEDQPQVPLDSDSFIDPPTAIPDADPDLVIGLFPRRSLSPQASSADEDTLSTYYSRIGYLPPLSESTLEVVRQVLADPTMGAGAGRLTTESEQQDGLVGRNVNWYPWPDPYRTVIESLPTSNHEAAIPSLSTDDEEEKNKKWDDDLAKCRLDPQEFVFQRTVMMSMVNRHRFIYDTKGVLDFAVERVWTCSPMPTRALLEEDGKTLPMSQPDISIAFRRTAVINDHYETLPPTVRQLVCYEGLKAAQQLRAFHFFAIEAKNTYKSLRDPVSQFQVLNTASQSLHNMYEFFNEAGPEHLANFFDKVRVFTAVSTTDGIIIRVHRACLTREFRGANPSHPDLPPPKDHIVPDYPLQFEYDIYFEAHANDFTRKTVLSTLEKIIINYGAGKLLGLLQNAAKVVAKNFKAHKLKRKKHYYSHHQNSEKKGGKSTPAPSHISQVTAETSNHGSLQQELYSKNIQLMHTLNKTSSSRINDDPEHEPPASTPPTSEQILVRDPNASLSENFESGLNVDDPVRSSAEQPRPATVPSQRDALPPRQPAGKRREVHGSEVAGHQPRARSSRPTRSNKKARIE
ncbi:hypothetical protein J7T55_002777 [Diaporthe amygdali]|uniref:uncharacterized protein n=1 Tax=Phomopsis amygdali TaxID=1214568 RepID=UPI0022FF1888|nr:uncharacterized protein J7T55_002777 [Diaporthe amygdali]KAJ0122265.1 hypothetical protein J7T55_002777 [Diaporthe amygdali]